MVIGNSDVLAVIKDTVTDVHITFRPSEREIFQLINGCPDLKSIQLPESHIKNISSTTKSILRLRGIELLTGKTSGAEKYIL